MSGFDEFIEKAKKVATRAAGETVKFTDVTTTKVKIKAEEAKLCERYERLGRAAYKMLSEMSVVSDEIAEALGEQRDGEYAKRGRTDGDRNRQSRRRCRCR